MINNNNNNTFQPMPVPVQVYSDGSQFQQYGRYQYPQYSLQQSVQPSYGYHDLSEDSKKYIAIGKSVENKRRRDAIDMLKELGTNIKILLNDVDSRFPIPMAFFTSGTDSVIGSDYDEIIAMINTINKYIKSNEIFINNKAKTIEDTEDEIDKDIE